MVFLEMIAVDDASFIRFQATNGSVSSPPTTTLGLNGILTNATYSNRVTDVATVTGKLNKYHISYQIFTAVVPISSR